MNTTNTQTKHTPGPWHLAEYGVPIKTICVVRGETKIARIAADIASLEEWQIANAHLIAAAPSMYEALKRLSREHQDLLQEHYGHYPMNCIDYAFEALSKAEGHIKI